MGDSLRGEDVALMGVAAVGGRGFSQGDENVLWARRGPMLEHSLGGDVIKVARMVLWGEGLGGMPGMGVERRTHVPGGKMVGGLWEMVVRHLMARIQKGSVRSGGI